MSLVALWLVTDAGAWAATTAHDLPVDVAIGLSYTAAAVLVLSGSGGRRIGWLLLGIGCCGAVAALSSAAIVAGTGPPSLVSIAESIESGTWVALRPAAHADPAALPRRPPPRSAVAAVDRHFRGGHGASRIRLGDVPRGCLGLALPRRRPHVGAVLPRRDGRARDPMAACGGAGRRQVAVLLVTATVLVVDTLLQPLLAWPVGALSQAVAVALVPLGIGVAVTRHRLYDLDLAVCRAIGGLVLAVCLAAIYVSLFLLASAVLPGGPTVGATTAAAVCRCRRRPARCPVEPGRRPDVLRRPRRSRAGPRGDRHRAARGSRPLGRTRAGLHGGGRVAASRLGSHPSRRWIGRRTSRRGTPGGPVTSLPMWHRGEVVGTLRVTARPG